ncbi:OmpA family protein [Aureisphaera galaxeae]|uniref:OmpA family protein n=1 Tax=Aureisphaera galaxeae TaxID=1538023 RepID=UPI0023503813|nr:OmpA family protein [Aureisphaera galaxeae]MDC8003365.1 OmpA family protein [Aureisphaera galaxeae]
MKTIRKMGHTTIKNYIILVLLALVGSAYGQEARLAKANKKYADRYYVDAAEIYERVAESGYESGELYKKLGNTHYFNSEYGKALPWYEKLVTLGEVDEHIYLLRYAQTLKNLGHNQKAEQVFNEFLSKTGNEGTYNSAQSYLDIIMQNSNRYEIRSAAINTEAIEYGGTLVEDMFIYASNDPKEGVTKRIDGWTDSAFLDLWSATMNKETGDLEHPKRLKGKVNKRYHESSPVFTKDGNTMYLTRSNYTPRLASGDKYKENLKIYRTRKNPAGDWDNFEDLSINADTYSTAHPMLSPDGNTLYYVSNQAGGFGETDIYRVTINVDGSLGVPRNLGPAVNTKGRESFPFITETYEMYFSSDGHFGLGGYDVFYIDLKSEDPQMINVGRPVNGEYDDFAFKINNETKKGVFSSNRTGGAGMDDIYLFTELESIMDATKALISGTITDKKTGDILQGANVMLKDIRNNVVAQMLADGNGQYEFEYNGTIDHTVSATLTDYDGSDSFVPKGLGSRVVDLQLDRNKVEVQVGTDIGPLLNLSPIYFDFDKDIIKRISEMELAKVVSYMKDNPNISLEVGSHTDSRGSDTYNQRLSEMRAAATVRYIIAQGIDSNRISSKGYGESRLLNACSNGVDCSEDDHSINRRSEFVIVKIE